MHRNTIQYLWQVTTTANLLLLTVVCALAVRLVWMFTYPYIINMDGAEYARIAENLLAGQGYRGTTLGVNVIFPPLYPLLITTLLPFTGSAELAGRLLSGVVGALLVVPVYGLGARLFNPRAGILAAIIVALHPYVIWISTSVLSEAIAATLVLSGVYWAVRALDLERGRYAIYAGIWFGLAYLTRPEAILFVGVPLGMLAVVGLARRKYCSAALSAATLVAMFALLAALYIAFLSFHLGYPAIEGKSNINYIVSQRMIEGMSFGQAAFGVDAAGRAEGPLLDPNAFVNREVYKRTLTNMAWFLLGNVPSVVNQLLLNLRSPAGISWVLLVLAAVGVLASRPRERWPGLLLLCGIIAAHIFVQLSATFFWKRYTYSFLPLLAIWAGAGLVLLYDGARRLVERWRVRVPTLSIGWRGAIVGITVTYIFLLVIGLQLGLMATSAPLPPREIGQWLDARLATGSRIMSDDNRVPYYAGAEWLPLPKAKKPEAVLRYIETQQPDILILTSHSGKRETYVEKWANEGLPHARARLLRRVDLGDDTALFVYAWNADALSHMPAR